MRINRGKNSDLGYLPWLVGCVVGFSTFVYLGFYIMFIGGIIQILEAVKMEEISSWEVAVGIARVVCSSLSPLVGLLGFYVSASATEWVLTKFKRMS